MGFALQVAIPEEEMICLPSLAALFEKGPFKLSALGLSGHKWFDIDLEEEPPW